MRQGLVILMIGLLSSIAAAEKPAEKPTPEVTPENADNLKTQSEDGSVVILGSSKKIKSSTKLLPSKTRIGRDSTGNVSLSELVRLTEKSRAARKQSSTKVRVITNETLGLPPEGSPGTVSSGDTEPIQTGPYKDDQGHDEAWWRSTMSEMRNRVSRGEFEVKALNDRIAQLQTSYYNQDDPVYRDQVIRPQWDAARDQLVAEKAKLEENRRRLADLDTQARRSGALPGWLR